MFERIFIDATYTFASGKNSGIERVVRSLLRESGNLAAEGKIPQPQSVVSIEGKFYAPTPQQLSLFSQPAAMHANVLSQMPRWYRALAEVVCRVIPSTKLRKWALPQTGHLGMFKLPHNMYESRVRRRIASQCQPLQFRPNDLVLLPDAYWVNRLRSSIWPAAQAARQQGSLIATLLYDLIPLTHPEFVGIKRQDAFLEYVKKTVAHSDLLLAISDTVRDQVADFIPQAASSDMPACQNIRSFPLGAELENVTGTVREPVRALFDRDDAPYLMVATFDPRKNHRYLLDAFDLLWNDRPDLKLCLVGRIGSRCDDIVQRIQQHPRLGKSLFLFSDLTDAELHHCYAGSRGVIFPSVVEGFGLPIVESLWFGKKTFVSDTPIHREVGGADCSYFGLDNPRSLIEQLLSWERLLSLGSAPTLPTRKLTTWRDSASRVFELCQQVADQRGAVCEDSLPTHAPASPNAQELRRAA